MRDSGYGSTTSVSDNRFRQTGIFFLLGADEGAGLDAGDVAGQGARQEAVRALVGVEAGEPQ